MKKGKGAGGQYMEQLEIRIREGRQIGIRREENQAEKECPKIWISVNECL